jgi:signal peptidase I
VPQADVTGPPSTGEGSGPDVQPKHRSVSRELAELPILAAIAIVVAVLIKSFIAQAFFIPSTSMVPQLKVNDRVVVSKLAYRLHPPHRGDIVVFDAPPSEQTSRQSSRNPVVRLVRNAAEAIGIVQVRTEFIKRVVGLPGETVEGRNGHVYVNGQYLDEPYLPAGVLTSSFAPVVIPHGDLWVMGDNRDNSRDSRVFGPIQRSKVVGRTIWRVWPPGHLSFL